MKHPLEPRVVQTITSIGEGVARSLDHVRVRPRLRDAIAEQPFAEVADAIDRHVAELRGVSLGSELLRSVPGFEPATRDAFANHGRAHAFGWCQAVRGRPHDRNVSRCARQEHFRRAPQRIDFASGGAQRSSRAVHGSVLARASERAFGDGSDVWSRGSRAAGLRASAAGAAGAAVLAVVAIWWGATHQGAPGPAPASLPPVVAPVAVQQPAAPPPVAIAPRAQPHVAAPRAQHVAAPPPVRKRAPAKVAAHATRPPRHIAAATHPKPAHKLVAAAPAPAPDSRAPEQSRASVPAPAAPAALAVAAPLVATSIETDGSSTAQLSAALVNTYLRAIVSGDEATAFADLGGARGDRGLALTEEEFIDLHSRIVSLRAKQVARTTASVEAEIQTAKGLYYTTFRVEQNAKGAFIAAHDFIKP